MHNTGVMVDSWPWTPGSDGAGIVVKAGKNAVSVLGKPLKEGDHVYGCMRLGSPGYGVYAEYYLARADLVIPADSLKLDEAATIGVASYVSFHCASLQSELTEIDLWTWNF